MLSHVDILIHALQGLTSFQCVVNINLERKNFKLMLTSPSQSSYLRALQPSFVYRMDNECFYVKNGLGKSQRGRLKLAKSFIYEKP